MGCICSKGVSTNEYVEKESKRSSKRFLGSSRRDESVVEVDHSGNDGNDATARLISDGNVENGVSSGRMVWDDGDRKSVVVFEEPVVQAQPFVQSVQKAANVVKVESGSERNGGVFKQEISRVISVGNGGEEAAGWPGWLTAVAGEAIKGWSPRRADSFEKLDKIGQGTYSSVYRARDLESGKIVALKKVRFAKMDPESVRFMAREIIVLRRLDHPNVMKLEGLLTSRVPGNLYLVFEYMEHDLAGLAASPMIKFSEAQIKCYMQQLLCGLEHCHNRGVLHRDIKGSNLLIDNNGNLKIGDFGLATIFSSNQRQPLTSRVVTLWYRPPELLLGATDYGIAVDLWSAGCILAELFAGKPIMPGRTEVEQLHKIFKLCGSPSEEYWRKSRLPHATIFKPQQPYKRCVSETFKDFPPSALALLDSLIAVEPDNRGSCSSALQSEFFTTKPLPCHPSSLPKYPPSKEYDAKMREDELRRNKGGGGKTRGVEPQKNGTRESRAKPEPDANAELHASIRKRLEQQNTKSSSEKFNREEDGGSGFPIEPSRGSLQYGMYNGRSKQPDKPDEPHVEHYKHRGAQLSKFSNSLAWHGSSRLDHSKGTSSHWPEDRPNGKYHQLNDADSSHSHSMLDEPNCSYKKHEHAPLKGYAPKKNRIHYSGPLVPPGGNMDEMLKEHERQIQHAVRKARLDKSKIKKGHSDNGQRESLLQYGGNLR
ncbi:protein kinase superfamily protein [Artemisia annua]|uniref:Protein kinase superfamily protein n=1 Tax=Artemisia annua TaxID=35608 RepID=A0A2U1KXS3_ARTAN|nr:protein kinase superfamily protein [Artemisia annua]